jgi:predicted nucleic acid-binding protein
MQKGQVVYWDSDCFLGYLKGETDKIAQCKGATDSAEKGNLVIATSAITLIEVVKLNKQLRLEARSEKTIRDFFSNPYIYIHNVDREVGIAARDLIWKHNLAQRDAIHVATAIKLSLSKMHTFDIQLHGLSNKYGDPKLQICKPDIEYQAVLPFLNEEEK